ncbi:replication initiation protein [Corynebacterium resistens]
MRAEYPVNEVGDDAAGGDYLGGDTTFAHRLSRSPFYAGDDPTAYRWHCQHRRVDHLPL